jgi:hypothetical protein
MKEEVCLTVRRKTSYMILVEKNRTRRIHLSPVRFTVEYIYTKSRYRLAQIYIVDAELSPLYVIKRFLIQPL